MFSGGTGSGVAANFATIGIGEDTGGSVRGPAAVSSLVGLRPTVPLVSRYGMFPARPSTDTVGPMARTVRDAAIILDAIAGYDPNDPITSYAVGHIPTSYTPGNYHDDDVPGPDAGVQIQIAGIPDAAKRVLLRHYRIDDTHSNAWSVWKKMGSPQQPTHEQYAALEAAGQLQELESPRWIGASKQIKLDIRLPRQGVSLLQLSW